MWAAWGAKNRGALGIGTLSCIMILVLGSSVRAQEKQLADRRYGPA
ncbi:MAG: hypothetical protein ACRDHY_08250 [Anaerolineales bacterium]|jgi:hypothetical protein